MHSHQTTNFHDQTPFHKLTAAQGKAWCMPGRVGEEVRRKMAGQLAQMYPQGVGVCSPTMKLVASVERSGALRLLVAPFKVIPISAIANKPAETECPCQSFWDPEVRGPWRERGLRRHHPFCQYDRKAVRVFGEVYKAKQGGVIIDSKGVAHRDGQKQKVRPDLMLRVQKAI